MMLPKNPNEFGATGHATYFNGSDCSLGSDGTTGHCYFGASGGVKEAALWILKWQNMINKIIIRFIILTVCFESKSFGQKKMKNESLTQEFEKNVIKSIKQIVFCKCIQNGYINDSLVQRDPSTFIISDINLQNFGSLKFADSLAILYLAKLPKYQPEKQSESLKIKPILLNCIQYYESRQLDSAVRKFAKVYLANY
jgi:hypothetical protein